MLQGYHILIMTLIVNLINSESLIFFLGTNIVKKN